MVYAPELSHPTDRINGKEMAPATLERPGADELPSEEVPAMDQNTCRDCLETKPLTEFGTLNGQPRSCCKPCFNVKRRAAYRKYPSILADVRKRNLARYGLTPDDYDRQHAEQNGLCMICGKPETATGKLGEPKMLSVDHNHETGAVRDLLCGPCNFMVGFLEKNPVDPHLFVAYLDRHRATVEP